MQCDASTQVGDKNLAQLRELNAMFTRLDKDGDGTVDAEEARTGCLRGTPGSFEARASHARKLL